MLLREPSEFERERLSPHKHIDTPTDRAVKAGLAVAFLIFLCVVGYLLVRKPPPPRSAGSCAQTVCLAQANIQRPGSNTGPF